MQCLPWEYKHALKSEHTEKTQVPSYKGTVSKIFIFINVQK